MKISKIEDELNNSSSDFKKISFFISLFSFEMIGLISNIREWTKSFLQIRLFSHKIFLQTTSNFCFIHLMEKFITNCSWAFFNLWKLSYIFTHDAEKFNSIYINDWKLEILRDQMIFKSPFQNIDDIRFMVEWSYCFFQFIETGAWSILWSHVSHK